jgi:DNA-binding NarL/FixJ family response regulator
MRTLYVSGEGSSAHQLRAEAPDSVVDVCSTLDAARGWLETRSYDAVLTDLTLADGTALALLEYVRVHEPGLPVVVVADADDGMRFAALEAGADDYVVRSAQVGKTLIAAVRAARDRRAYDHASRATCLHVLYIGRDAGLRQRLAETPSVRVTAAPPEFEIDLDVSLCHVAVIDARSLNAVHQVRKLREVAPSLPLALMAQPTDYEVDTRSLPLGVDEVIVRSENYQDQIVARLRRLAAAGRRRPHPDEDAPAPFSDWTRARRAEGGAPPAPEMSPRVVPVSVSRAADSPTAVPERLSPPPFNRTAPTALPPEPPPIERADASPEIEEVAADIQSTQPTGISPVAAVPDTAEPTEVPADIEEPSPAEPPATPAIPPSLDWLKGYVALRRRSRHVETAVNVLTQLNGLLETAITDHPEDAVIQRAHALSGDFVAFARAHTSPDEARTLDDELTTVAPMLRILIGGGTDLVISPGAAGIQVLMPQDEIVRILTSLVIAGRDTLPIGGRLILRTEQQMIRAGGESAAPPDTLLRVLRISVEARGHVAHPLEVPAAVRDLVAGAGGECEAGQLEAGLTGTAVCVPIVGDSIP